MYIAMSMSMTYIQLIQQCTLAIWGGGVTLNFYQIGKILAQNS